MIFPPRPVHGRKHPSPTPNPRPSPIWQARRRGKGVREGGEEGGGGVGGDGGDAEGGGGYVLWSAMAKETETLKRQLALLSGDPRFKVGVQKPAATAAAAALWLLLLPLLLLPLLLLLVMLLLLLRLPL